MKVIGLSILTLVLFSCSSKDEQFCSCLKAGEELNSFSSKLFTKEVTQADANKLKMLKSNQMKACKNYQSMNGPEMIKRKKECE